MTRPSTTERDAAADQLEQTLRAQPGVRDVHVERQRAGKAGAELTAYVLRTRADERKNELQENVWKTVFDGTFQRDEANDQSLKSAVWGSSYTGGAIDTGEIKDWVDAAVSRILALRPRRVLEIGSGDGQLLLRIAPQCERYEGTDFSAAAVSIVARKIADQKLSNVGLSERSALDFEGFEPGAFDVIVINSVVQYFPSLNYLLEVLGKCKTVLAPGGAIFLGDLRNLRWAKHFYVSAELHHASSDAGVTDVRDKVRKRVEAEKELLLDPSVAWNFVELLDLEGARAHVKTSRNQNELVRFRFDLTLHTKSPSATPPHAAAWRDWSELGSIAALKNALEAKPETLAVRGIPNARLVGLAGALQTLREADSGSSTLAELRSGASSSEGAVEPQDLFELAQTLEYEVELGPSAIAEQCDALFRVPTAAPSEAVFGAGPKRPVEECATEPTNRDGARFGKRLHAELAKAEPELAARAAVVIVGRIPRSADGSVQRESLHEDLV